MGDNPAHRAGAVVGVFAGDAELSLALKEGIGLVKHGCSPVDLGAAAGRPVSSQNFCSAHSTTAKRQKQYHCQNKKTSQLGFS